MKVKTKDLTGPALDWAVASIEKLPKDRLHVFYGVPAIDRECLGQIDCFRCEFSTNWAQGGPIIEREGINVFKHNKLQARDPDMWGAHKVVPRRLEDGFEYSIALTLDGPTPLVAAMRCFVTIQCGYEVEVPDILFEG